MKTFRRIAMTFGDPFFTPENKGQFVAALNKWREDAVVDGWECKPIYNTESVETAAELHKNGWTCHIYIRCEHSIQISVWAPDGHALLEIPEKYNMTNLQAQSFLCHFCNKHFPSQELKKVGFANIACPGCLSTAKQQIEFPGWCN
jgi:hypothetical protein